MLQLLAIRVAHYNMASASANESYSLIYQCIISTALREIHPDVNRNIHCVFYINLKYIWMHFPGKVFVFVGFA